MINVYKQKIEASLLFSGRITVKDILYYHYLLSWPCPSIIILNKYRVTK